MKREGACVAIELCDAAKEIDEVDTHDLCVVGERCREEGEVLSHTVCTSRSMRGGIVPLIQGCQTITRGGARSEKVERQRS